MLEAYTNSHTENPVPHSLYAENSVHSVHSGAGFSIIESYINSHAENTLLPRASQGNFAAFGAFGALYA